MREREMTHPIFSVLRLTGMFLLLMLFIPQQASGQVNPETAFYWENPYYISPASVRLDHKGYFSLSGRKQWSGYDGAPETFFGTAALYLEDYHTQAGVRILQDRIGYLSTLDLSLSYAYVLRLTWNSFLNMGIRYGYQSQSVDKEKITLEDWNDPALSAKRLKGFSQSNAGLGAEYVYDRSLTLGVSCNNLFSFLRDDPNIWAGTAYLYGKYRTRSLSGGVSGSGYRTRSLARSYDMEYGVCVKRDGKEWKAEGIVSLYLNRWGEEERFQVSLLARSVGEVGVLAGMKLVSELKVLFCYDYNFKEVSGNANGTFEVMLSYPMKRNTNTCRSVWDR